jgi:hypothetical protein
MMSQDTERWKVNKGSCPTENNMEKNQLIITPQTKILKVLEAYPELEDLLIAYVPAFKKLKNPVLRNTVAKVTNLQQVASIGNVKVGDLINKLRKEVGQELISGQIDTAYNFSQPDWFDKKLVENELDAREMLSNGEQPVNQVMADLKSMNAGKIYKLIAPFLVAPLIDKAASLEMDHWVDKKAEDLFLTYFLIK